MFRGARVPAAVIRGRGTPPATPRHKTILFPRENIRPEPEGIATKIRVARCFAEESADTPAVLEIEVEQADVPAADEILSFASVHGNFACIPDRIFRRFEVVLPPDSRLEFLKDALLEVIRLEPEGSEGLNPYEVEDFIDALERRRQKVLADNRT
ncbi:hypothetical protein [Methanoculleus sp. MH98A]|uniref:hypothetical protein n=1 Tax=Methanoculleus sp. MH98A TaxID=1495314 RepID=UPI00049F8424|nr:hypothetical protein [Methanoculleus sp. MH98A]KDE55931.1 hypothetical protein EI28_03335 [Methanoculleus sp. MH98A]